MKYSKSKPPKSPFSARSGTYGSNSRTVHQHHATAKAAVKKPQPASPVKPIYGSSSNRGTVHQHHATAKTVVTTSLPASPVIPESSVKPGPPRTPALATPNPLRDWSPLDDGIEVALPGSESEDKAPSREQVDSYISSVLHGRTAKRRLPVFEKICNGGTWSPR